MLYLVPQTFSCSVAFAQFAGYDADCGSSFILAPFLICKMESSQHQKDQIDIFEEDYH
jgi:hypothetical protein